MTEDGRRSRITTAALILSFGVVFLLRALGVLGERWWAMLVAASALPFLLGAWLRYRASGKFARSAVATSTIGLTMLAASVILYEEWSWGSAWPVFFLIVGVSFLLNTLHTK
jgi:cell wall-active antibiotic response 4TMS protein YvqF